MKRFLAILLVMALCLTLTTTAFAEEATGEIPEDATRHTVAVTLQPEESISPYIWGDPSITMVDNHTAYTSSFYVSDRYFAYEMEGFLEGDPVTNEGYVVSLEYVGGAIIASASCRADGTLYKLDWIDIYTDGNYRFKITNATDYVLTVYITYYSWN